MKKMLAALVIAAFSTMTMGIAFADDNPPKKEEKKKVKTKKAPKKKADETKKEG